MGATKMFTPYDLRPTVEITAFTLCAVSTLVVALRFYCRISVVGKLKLYDYMAIGALLSIWALCVCNFYQLKFGSGARAEARYANMTPEQKDSFRKHQNEGSAKTWYAYHIVYVFALASVKLSILVFYLSFATRRTFRVLVYITIAIVTAFGIVSILFVALQCPKHPNYAWSPGILKTRGGSHCFELQTILYWQAGFHMGSDLFILVLPMPLIFQLRMGTAKRVSLIAVFSAGLLVPIASAIRIWAVYLWAGSGRMTRYYGGYIIFWSQVELNTAIICASLPSLQPLIVKIFHRLSPLQNSREAYYYYAGGPNSMTLSPVAGTGEARCTREDSIIVLERPDPVHQPNRHVQDDEKVENTVVNLTAEEEIRQRVRAFSRHSPSLCTHTTPPTHPANIFAR